MSETIHLLAGQKPDGQLIFEQVRAAYHGDDCYELLTSPLFARGAAKGDLVRLLNAGHFAVERRSGNLCVRVMAKQGMDEIHTLLDAELKPLKAELDYHNERILVYSIPVTAGFKPVEMALNRVLQDRGDYAMWLYANVYDPQDGETPLNWWQDFLLK